MLRTFVSAALALVLCTSAALAAEYKGKVKSVDTDKNTITVTIDDKDRTFNCAKGDDLKVTQAKKELPQKLANKIFDKNPQVTIITEGEGEKEVVTEIRLGKKKEE